MIVKVITGEETTKNSLSPLAALVNFYQAFNNRDYKLMQTNWLQTEAISMSNPLGGVRRGWCEIGEVYKKIFAGKARVYVEFYDYTIQQAGEMFLAVGRERGFIEINDRKIDLAIRTSRIYGCYDSQWKQLHHHGSIDNPELLATYQHALLKNRRK